MEVACNRLRQVATIKISEVAYKEKLEEHEKLIIHEMLHVIFDPIRAEHELQMKSLQTNREAEYNERMMNEVEKAVEHLSLALYSLGSS